MSPSTTRPDRNAETAIRTLLAATETAWAAGDGTAYAACFTTDATYTTYIGTVYHGADEIGRAHQALFDKFLKGTRMTSRIEELRFLTPDVAVLTTRGHVGKPGRTGKAENPGDFDKVQTYTVVREPDGHWRIAAFQNTKQRKLMEAVSFKMLPESAPAGRS
jgi:uncharacterized protein (TIGR02246 family)